MRLSLTQGKIFELSEWTANSLARSLHHLDVNFFCTSMRIYAEITRLDLDKSTVEESWRACV